jgi:hypothetical protein
VAEEMTSEEREFYKEMALGICQRRENLKLTIKAVSRLTKLSVEHLTDIESGEWSVDCFSFFKLMDAFDKMDAEKTIEA